MTLFNVKGRYTDKQGRSHYFKLVSGNVVGGK